MKLHSTVHDCLYINWMLDPDVAPSLPAELDWDRRSVGGREHCFASLLLFRQRGLHWASMPWLPLSHPQANLRLYVIDANADPAVIFAAIWVPGWMSNLMQAIAKVPAKPARFNFPAAPVLPDLEGAWSLESGEVFKVQVRPGVSSGSSLGSWRQTVDFFRQREVGYIATEQGLRRIAAVQPEFEATPVSVSIAEAALVDHQLGGAITNASLQSAFLCEKLPFEFELSPAPSGVPQVG